MIKIKKILAAGVLGVLAFSVAGCGMIQKTPEAIKNTVLAKVDGEKITKGDVDEIAQGYLKQFEAQYGKDFESNPSVKEQVKKLRQEALNILVEQKIINKKAVEMNLAPTDEEVKAKVDETIASDKERFGGEEGFKNALEQSKLTEESYKNMLNKNVKSTMINEKVSTEIFKDINITDEDVKKYYDENQESFKGANSAHILLKDEDAAKAAKERITKGEDFATVAKELSEDPGTKEKGGDLGFIKYSSTDLVAEYMNAFKTLKDGEVSDPVKSQFGYHIIKATGVKTTPFEEAKDGIKKTLEGTKKNEVYTEKIKEWKDQSKVKTYESRL
ncbi:peptidylprolyl isomerase [Clostridium carnis]